MKRSLRMMQVLRIFRRQPLRQHPLLFLRDRRKINSNGVGLGVEKRQRPRVTPRRLRIPGNRKRQALPRAGR